MPTPHELGALIVATIKRALDPLAARLVAVERTAALVPPTFAGLEARLAVADGQARELAAQAARLAALEARPAAPDLGPVREALAALEARVGTVAPVVELLAVVRERVAKLEARPAMPGPPGPAGADGRGFDDLDVTLEGHTFAFTLAADRIKRIAVPFLVDCGVFKDGQAYEPGDVVSWGGSMYVCQTATTTGKPGAFATAAAWRLIVKCGRDGKDGAAGERGPAGPAGKDWQQTFDAARGR
jgi:hypothetical protein